MAIYIKCREPEHNEHKFLAKLTSDLPDDWVVLGNVEIVQAHRTPEIDAIVIGGGTVFALEAKNYWGTIRGDSHSWFLENCPNPKRSPILAIREKAKIVATIAKEAGVNRYVDGFVVLLANPPNKLEIDSPDVNSAVYTINNIVDRLTSRGEGLGLESNSIETFIKKVGGSYALSEYKKHVQQTQNNSEVSADLVFSLIQSDFERKYYSSDFNRIFLGKTELRGSHPNTWKDWMCEGIILYIDSNEIAVEAAYDKCKLNGAPLKKNIRTTLSIPTGSITICSIDFRYHIGKYGGE